MGEQYDAIASTYAWLVPDELLEPAGAAAAFAPVLANLPAGSRVLDCAAGTGQLAVGLALAGHRVVATDRSGGMVAEARRLARRHDVGLGTAVCAGDDLAASIDGPFDLVLCVGNSLTHAIGAQGRRRALAQMCAVLADDGVLAATSRNWERLLAARPRLEVDDRLVHRGGRTGLAIRSWTWPDDPHATHHLDVAVARLGPDGAIDTIHERLTFHPFTREELDADLRAAGLVRVSSTWTPDAERHLVTARPVRG